jgi:hypothetical protein
MAMAAIIRMIATTIKSSINEKPFCLFRIFSILPCEKISFYPAWNLNTGLYKALAIPSQTIVIGQQGY